jgi:hypothetical protein
VEIKSTRDSEKNQGTVLKAILQAKESKEIDGIYGHFGKLSTKSKYVGILAKQVLIKINFPS